MKTEDIIEYEKQLSFDALDIENNYDDPKCPLCGDYLVIYGRCKTCYSCGYSTCDL